MIRLIQRRLIIPRGDTGSFSIPILAGKNTGDVAVFTVFDLMTQKKLLEKTVTATNDTLTIEFNHNDTVNLPVGQFVWDIKYYVNPVFADGKLVDGEEIDSYYAAFTLPVCEIRQTGDMMLMVNDAALPPDQLDILLATLNATIAAKNEAATSAAEADTSATNAESSASAALASQQAALESQNAALASQQAAAASAQQALAGAELATIKAEQIATDISNKADRSEIPTKVSDLEDDSGHYTKPAGGIPAADLEETYLTSFTETDPTVPQWAKAQTKPSYTAQEVGALPANTFIPTNVSDLTNDAGYLTQHQDISGKANSADLAAVATSGSYNDLLNKPVIPTAVSDLTDDSGHYTKPVGGIPASDLANGVLDVWSGLTYHTSTMSTDSDSFVLGGATDAPTEINKCLVTSTPGANVIPKFDYQGRLHSITPEDEWDGSNAVATTEYVDNMISDNMPEIPTNVSELNNDAGYLTSYTETDPTVPSWAKAQTKPTYTASEVGAPTVQEMNTAIGTAIGNVHQFNLSIQQELPSQDIDTHTIYLIPKTGETNDVYDEYVYINNAWEMVGNTQIDLSNYVQKTDYATSSIAGVVKVNNDNGLTITRGQLKILAADTDIVKSGSNIRRPIVPSFQHFATFYGLAKAAGDTTQSQSDNAIGTYTTEAKAAIRSMIGAAASADVTVQDVQINGTSILSNNVANIPIASASVPGVIQVDTDGSGGLFLLNNTLRLHAASDLIIKTGTDVNKPITASKANTVVFYGLAKAAGDSTQSASSNAVGTYTSEASAAIRLMLGAASPDVIAVQDEQPTNADTKVWLPETQAAGIQVPTMEDMANYILKTDYATSSTPGIVQISKNDGIGISSGAHTLYVNAATSALVKAGADEKRPIVPSNQHEAVFYGLAKVAGDATQAASENVVGTYTTSAKSAIQTMLGIKYTLTVTVLTQDNVTVINQTITLREGGPTGQVYATATYNGQPVSFALPTGFSYYVSVSDTLAHHFNPTTASGIITDADASVTLIYSDFSSIQTAADIKAALNAGLDLTDLVGEQISCTWNNSTLVWDVVDYSNDTITLLTHDTLPTQLVFEPVQALMWCENGLAAGSYSFIDGSSTYYFTLTTAIPSGGQLRATTSAFQTYASMEATATLETGTVSTTEISGATSLGTTANGNLNHMSRVNYGSNNYKESALFQWLNSTEAANTPMPRITKFSRPCTYSVPGFLGALDSSFVAAIDDTTWLCSTNNTYECPTSLGGTVAKSNAYTVTAKVGLASEMEIFGSYGGTADGSTVFDLFNGATADDRKKYQPGTSTARYWWLRSPHWSYAYYERNVGSSGAASSGGAYDSRGVVPAVKISKTVVSE